MDKLIIPVFLLMSSLAGTCQSSGLKIGLIADIQYCDCPTAGAREYRLSPSKLEQAVTEINREGVDLTVELGDLIDRDYSSFEPVAGILERLISPWIFLPGNHDFNVADSLKKEVWRMIPDRNGYWGKVAGNYCLLFLNGLNNSTIAYPTDSPDHQLNRNRLDELEERKAPNAYEWNGGLGEKQLKWIAKQVKNANRNNRKLVVFCHQPAVPGSEHSLWDTPELLKILSESKQNVLYICGHKHSGGDTTIGNVRVVNLKGMVEMKKPTFAILTLHARHWEIKGFGEEGEFEGKY
jgi:manganese-dependent ADP-ribose/CDP-alcohol diphosphatase